MTSRTTALRAALAWLLPLAAALLVMCIYHRQTLLSGLDLVQSVANDSLFVGYVLEHWHRVLGGDATWHSPAMYHPVVQTLGHSDALLGFALPYHLLRSCGLDPFVALNVTSMLLTLLAFICCYLLLRRFFGLSMLACCVGAGFFALSHPRFTQLVHVQLQFVFLVPLVVWAVLFILQDGARVARWRLAVVSAAAGLMMAMQLATAIYICWFLALLLLLFLLMGCAARTFRRRLIDLLRARWYVLLPSMVLPALLALPVLNLYLRFPIRWSYQAIVQHVPAPAHLLWMSRENALWGALQNSLLPVEADHALGVGVVFSLAWIAVTVAAGRWLVLTFFRPESGTAASTAARLARLLILASLLLVLFCVRLGDEVSPWWLVYHTVPGAGGIRVVSRFVLLLTLAVALAGALGIDWCVAVARRRFAGVGRWLASGALVAAALFGLAEQVGTTITYSGSERYARLVQLSKKVDRSCPTFLFKHGALAESARGRFSEEAYFDVNPDIRQRWKGSAWQHYDKLGRQQCRFVSERAIWTAIVVHLEAMWVSALTGVPTLNGYSAKHPEGWPFHNLCCDGFNRGLEEWLQRHQITDRPCVVQVTF